MESVFINYIQPIPPSLRNTAIVPIVTKVLAQPDVENELLLLLSSQRDSRKRNVEFCKIQEKVVEKLTLILPKNLHNEVIHFLKPIALQLLKCFDNRNREYYSLYDHSTPGGSVFWTTNGTIDKIKTLKHRILNESPDRDYRTLFELACKYCCEEYILELWKKISPENHKSINLTYNSLTLHWIRSLRCKFPTYFTQIIESKRFQSIAQSYDILDESAKALRSSVFNVNFLATKYFWYKSYDKQAYDKSAQFFLTECLQISDALGLFERQGPDERTDIIFFLMSRLRDTMEQKHFFLRYPKVILKSLLFHWPWQMYFLSTINVMWSYLDENLYVEIMSDIASESKDVKAFEALLKEVWGSSPKRFKKPFVLYSLKNLCIMKKLLQVEKEEAIITSLDNTSLEERTPIDNYEVLLFLIDIGNFDFIDKYLHWYFDTDKGIKDFKDEFVEEKTSNVLEILNGQEDGFSNYKKFLKYFCYLDNEAVELEEYCYHHAFKVIQSGNFQLAAKILIGCNPNVDIVHLKNEMMQSSKTVDLFFEFLHQPRVLNVLFDGTDWKRLKSAIKWFSPYSRKVVSELKTKLDHLFHQTLWHHTQSALRKKTFLFHLLDCLIDGDFPDNHNYSLVDDYTLFLLAERFNGNMEEKEKEKNA